MWHFLFFLQSVTWFFLNLFGKGVMILFYLICLMGKTKENPLDPKGTKKASVDTEACFFILDNQQGFRVRYPYKSFVDRVVRGPNAGQESFEKPKSDCVELIRTQGKGSAWLVRKIHG